MPDRLSSGRKQREKSLDRIGAFRTLARGLLLFWAAYFTIITLTNLLDAAKSAGALPAGWSLASGNYALMMKVTAVHGTPTAVVAALFLGVIVWEALAAFLFWRALIARTRRAVYAAFTVALALWGAFTLVDELYVAYALTATHLRLFGVQLVSLLALRLLPED